MGEFDPRSINYKRFYNRPSINKAKIILILYIYVLLMIFLFNIFNNIIVLILFTFTYIVINLKNIVILIVKLYQRFAPINIRSKCRFEPSCSNYMLIAIEKYGLIIGLKKGVKRLKKCNIDNGGYDYP